MPCGARSCLPRRATLSSTTSHACAPCSGRRRSSPPMTDTRWWMRPWTPCDSRSCSERRASPCAKAMPPPGRSRLRWRSTCGAVRRCTGSRSTTWFSAEARRLEVLRVDALEEQFEAALALGEHREIVSALRTAVEENPFRERLWAQLMLALYRSGRQADALDTSRKRGACSQRSWGSKPGPDLQRLQAAILAHEPAIAAGPVVSRRGNLPTPHDVVRRPRARARRRGRAAARAPAGDVDRTTGGGKSRLALEVVRSLEARSRDGIWLVELRRAGGAAVVVRLVAQVPSALAAPIRLRA